MHCFVFIYTLGHILKRFVDLENTLNLCQIVLNMNWSVKLLWHGYKVVVRSRLMGSLLGVFT